MKGMILWVMTKVEYDAYGNATVLQSFVKPAHDSPVKGKKKSIKRTTKKPAVQSGETKLW